MRRGQSSGPRGHGHVGRADAGLTLAGAPEGSTSASLARPAPPARRRRDYGRLVFATAALAYVVFAADMLTRAIPWLVGIVPDDAYYYLETARHLASTGRSTFDGENPTNGYHPGWMLIVVALARTVDRPEPLLRVAVATTLALHFATAVVLIGLLRGALGRWWAGIGAAAWLWSPLPMLLALQAMETPLLLFAVALFARVYFTRILPGLERDSFDPTRRDLVLLGLTLTLVAWARTDALVLVLCALAQPLWIVAGRGSARRAVDAARRMGIAAAVVLAALVPWWTFSWAVVGTIVQDSAAMKALWGTTRGSAILWQRLRDIESFVHRAVSTTIAHLTGPPLSDLADTWYLLGVVLVVLGAIRSRTAASRRAWRLLAVLAVGVVALLGTYGFVLADVQVWYLGLPGLVLWLAGFLAAAVLAGRARRGHFVGIAITAVAAVLGARFWRDPPVPYAWQRDVLRSLPAFESLTPAGARIGSFNAGIPAFFGERTVVNLDGLVNHGVQPYWRARRFDDYLRDARIDWVADEEGALRRALTFSAEPPTLVPVSSHSLTDWSGGRRVLWRVEVTPHAADPRPSP